MFRRYESRSFLPDGYFVKHRATLRLGSYLDLIGLSTLDVRLSRETIACSVNGYEDELRLCAALSYLSPSNRTSDLIGLEQFSN